LCVFCVYIVSSETASRPKKRLMRTYHWISLFKSYIKSIIYTVCPQSLFGVFKNFGAQTNWASRMQFAADYRETLEVFYWLQVGVHVDRLLLKKVAISQTTDWET
jgi:hypothetical protein